MDVLCCITYSMLNSFIQHPKTHLALITKNWFVTINWRLNLYFVFFSIMFLVFYFLMLTFQIMYLRYGRMRKDHWIDWRWFRRKRSWPNRGTVLYSRECSWPAQRGYSPLTLATTVGRKTYRAFKKHESPSLHELISAGRHLLGVSLIVPKVKFIGSSYHVEHYRK